MGRHRTKVPPERSDLVRRAVEAASGRSAVWDHHGPAGPFHDVRGLWSDYAFKWTADASPIEALPALARSYRTKTSIIKLKLNGVLLNWYDASEGDYIGPHADDEGSSSEASRFVHHVTSLATHSTLPLAAQEEGRRQLTRPVRWRSRRHGRSLSDDAQARDHEVAQAAEG